MAFEAASEKITELNPHLGAGYHRFDIPFAADLAGQLLSLGNERLLLPCLQEWVVVDRTANKIGEGCVDWKIRPERTGAGAIRNGVNPHTDEAPLTNVVCQLACRA